MAVRITWLGACFATTVALTCSNARANGRYPLANQLVVDPSAPSHMVARATFGVLETKDSGGSWSWICENAIGYFGIEDPPIAVTTEGSTLVASSNGLSVSHDRGCSWTKSDPTLDKYFGIDVTALSTGVGEALALVSVYQDGGYTDHVTKTIDDGATFADVGPPLPSDFLAATIEIARTNPDRIYLSGKISTSGRAAIGRSDDGGATWTRSLLDTAGPVSIYIGAVDPSNPDIIYVRTRGLSGDGHVLVSYDAGATFREVWSAPDEALGFALSPDGATLAVGGEGSGVNVASTADFRFHRANAIAAYCLTWSGSDLLVCSKEALAGFSIGISVDRGANFTALLHLPDVTPQHCEAESSTFAVCGDYWTSVATAIGADAGPRTDQPGPIEGGPRDAPAERDASTDQVRGAGGCSCSVTAVDRSPWRVAVSAMCLLGGLRFAGRKRRDSTTTDPQTSWKTTM